MTGFPVPIT